MNSDTAYNFVFVCSTIFTLLIQSDITGNVYIWAKLAISQPLLSLLKDLIENILHIIEYPGSGEEVGSVLRRCLIEDADRVDTDIHFAGKFKCHNKTKVREKR